MFQKYLVKTIFGIAVLAISGTLAIAQSSPVRGEVKLKKEDGTMVPVADATIDSYRTDLESGKGPSTKTNKRGEFSFVGFPLGHMYVLAVSAPGIGPRIQPNVKGGMEQIVFVVNEGDGRQLSEEEVRAAAKESGDATGAPMNSEQRAAAEKQRAEYEKKNAEIMAANKKAEDTNKVVNAALKAGEAAFKSQNYDVAIVEFDKGIAADPDFEGSAPIFLNFKGVALQKRAMVAYNAAVASGDVNARIAVIEKIKPDLTEAIASYNRGLEVLKVGTADLPPTEQAKFASSRLNLLSNLLDVYGLAARVAPDPSREGQGGVILDQYIAAETDPARRTTLLLSYAGNMNGAGELKTAVAAYRKVLEQDPNNLDALAGIGLALYSIGYDPVDKEVLQEGLNYMQRFVDTAPDSHKLKESTKDVIELLKTEQKLKAQPVKAAPPRKKG